SSQIKSVDPIYGEPSPMRRNGYFAEKPAVVDIRYVSGSISSMTAAKSFQNPRSIERARPKSRSRRFRTNFMNAAGITKYVVVTSRTQYASAGKLFGEGSAISRPSHSRSEPFKSLSATSGSF